MLRSGSRYFTRSASRSLVRMGGNSSSSRGVLAVRALGTNVPAFFFSSRPYSSRKSNEPEASDAINTHETDPLTGANAQHSVRTVFFCLWCMYACGDGGEWPLCAKDTSAHKLIFACCFYVCCSAEEE